MLANKVASVQTFCDIDVMSTSDPEFQPSALLAFRAENARSFKEEIELSLLATAMAEKQSVRSVPWREGGTPVRVLPVAGAFGANGSGKSNLLKVMDDMRRLVLSSFRASTPGEGMPRWPFRLDEQSPRQPSRYEVNLVLHGVRHEYGFELDDEQVVKEWAHFYPRGRAALLFHRQGEAVRLGAAERPRSRETLKLLRPNALFLSTAAALGHPALSPLYEWFVQNLRLAEADSRLPRQVLTAEMLDDGPRRKAVLQLLRAADLGITGVRKQLPDPAMQEKMRRVVHILMETDDESDHDPNPALTDFGELTGVNLVHRGGTGDVELENVDESLGTLVWFGLVGPVIQSLTTGAVLLADELDASLHPDLVAQLVRLYQNPSTNPRHAQLVFNSHDTSLLPGAVGERLLGRDQIWFTQKLNDGRTELYQLIDFDPRKQEAVGKRYLDGWYGAKPIISSAEFESAVERALSAVN